jgi:endothelin-converting enzyme/putative endopeptidase
MHTSLRTGLLLVLLSTLSFGQADSQSRSLHSIQPGDMNRQADPCQDFFEYANGKWRADNPIPPSMVRWSRRWQAGETTKDVLKEILEESAKNMSTTKDPVEKQVGTFYASCTNEAAINANGVKAVKAELDLIDGAKSTKDLPRVLTALHVEALQLPFAFGSFPDQHNPGSVIADTGSSGLGLPDRDYYFKEDSKSKETREKYLEHVAKTFQLAGWDGAKSKAAADTIMKMETALAGASLTNVELRDPAATDHKMSIAEAQKYTPSFNWTQFLKAMNVPANTPINVEEPKFLQEFERQLTQTPLDDWKTYLKWHVLRTASSSLSDPFVQQSFSFYQQYLGGQKEMKPRWKRCTEATDNYLGEALGQKYVEKKFGPEAKRRIQELVNNILATLKDEIPKLDWMSADTKQAALKKLSTFNPKVGYPDKWKDYSSLKLRSDNYWNNVVEGRKFAVRDDAALIGKPVDRGRWGMTPPTSNAYYNPLLNEIVFPAGILLPPMFDVNAVDAVNYGGIGPVIGHEISHGFDDQGAQYDFDGSLHNWWKEADYKEFQKRSQCVVDQFNNYEVEGGLKTNGKLVLGESIGDLAGVKLAYYAYMKSLEGKPRPADFDGFTPEQQFFISWGQSRGDAIRAETQRQMVLTDPHPIGKWRVNGPLSNLSEFQKAFHCKAGDAMVRPPEKKCEIW